MGKFSLHIEHFKREQIHGLEMHHLRKGKTHSNYEIRPELSKNNEILICPKKSVFQDVKSDIETKIQGRVTKASIWISELVMTLPQEIPIVSSKEYFADCLEFLKGQFQEDCIKLAVIHMDETRPHCHCMIEPRTIDNKLSRKEIFTRSYIQNLHREMPKYLNSKGWKLEESKSTEHGDYRKSIKELKEETRKLEKLNQTLIEDSKVMMEANYKKVCKIYERYKKLNREISR